MDYQKLNEDMIPNPIGANSLFVCSVSVNDVEECFARRPINYIPKGDKRVAQHILRLEHRQEAGEPTLLPFLVFELRDNGLTCAILDGRHTFCVMRDSGLKTIKVVTEHCRARVAVQNGFELIPEDDKAIRIINKLKEKYNGTTR